MIQIHAATPILHAPPHTNSQLLFPHDLPFGDKIHQLKDDNIFQIGFCNIGGFPAMPLPNDKAQELKPLWPFTTLIYLEVARPT